MVFAEFKIYHKAYRAFQFSARPCILRCFYCMHIHTIQICHMVDTDFAILKWRFLGPQVITVTRSCKLWRTCCVYNVKNVHYKDKVMWFSQTFNIKNSHQMTQALVVCLWFSYKKLYCRGKFDHICTWRQFYHPCNERFLIWRWKHRFNCVWILTEPDAEQSFAGTRILVLVSLLRFDLRIFRILYKIVSVNVIVYLNTLKTDATVSFFFTI